MDGYEAAEALRKQEALHGRARVAVVALTASAMAGDDKRCFASGMDDYMTKPIRRTELERVLSK